MPRRSFIVATLASCCVRYAPDELFAQLIDADLGGGLSDASGWVLRAGYAPMKSVTLNAT